MDIRCTALSVVLALGCHRTLPAGTTDGGTAVQGLPREPAVDADAALTAPVQPQTPPPTPWCYTPRPLADLRAIDARGSVWSITAGKITDETHGVTSPLADEIPCPSRGGWGLEFTREGSAFALVDSRFYVRPQTDAPFGVTPMCTDVAGAPWSPRVEGGWAFVARTWPANGPGMMLTNDRSGESGWYAVTALDNTLAYAVLEPDRSMVFLANQGHLLFVDQTRHVAGEVLLSHGSLFTGLGRTPAGVVAFRDQGTTRRVLVTAGTSVQQPFAETVGERPVGPATRAVFRADVARVLAVTDAGVELSTDRGAHWVRVLDTPTPLERPAFGWLEGAHPALTTRTGIATDHCLYTGSPDR